MRGEERSRSSWERAGPVPVKAQADPPTVGRNPTDRRLPREPSCWQRPQKQREAAGADNASSLLRERIYQKQVPADQPSTH